MSLFFIYFFFIFQKTKLPSSIFHISRSYQYVSYRFITRTLAKYFYPKKVKNIFYIVGKEPFICVFLDQTQKCWYSVWTVPDGLGKAEGKFDFGTAKCYTLTQMKGEKIPICLSLLRNLESHPCTIKLNSFKNKKSKDFIFDYEIPTIQ